MATLYVQSNEGSGWIEVGTGRMGIHYAAVDESTGQSEGPMIVVHTDNETLLQTPIGTQDIYSVQGNILVWCDPEIGKEIAIHFDDMQELRGIYGTIRQHTSNNEQWKVSVENLSFLVQSVQYNKYKFAEFINATPSFVKDLCALRRARSATATSSGNNGSSQHVDGGEEQELSEASRKDIATLILALISPPYNTDDQVLKQIVEEENIDDVLYWIYEADRIRLLHGGGAVGVGEDGSEAATGAGAALPREGSGRASANATQFFPSADTCMAPLADLEYRLKMHKLPIDLGEDIVKNIRYIFSLELLRDSVPLLMSDGELVDQSPLGLYLLNLRSQVVDHACRNSDFVTALFDVTSEKATETAADRLGVLQDILHIVHHLLISPDTTMNLFLHLVENGLMRFLSFVLKTAVLSEQHKVTSKACEILERSILHFPHACLNSLLGDTASSGPSVDAKDLCLLDFVMRHVGDIKDAAASECMRDVIRALGCQVEAYCEHPGIKTDSSRLRLVVLGFWITGSVHMDAGKQKVQRDIAVPMYHLLSDCGNAIEALLDSRRCCARQEDGATAAAEVNEYSVNAVLRVLYDLCSEQHLCMRHEFVDLLEKTNILEQMTKLVVAANNEQQSSSSVAAAGKEMKKRNTQSLRVKSAVVSVLRVLTTAALRVKPPTTPTTSTPTTCSQPQQSTGSVLDRLAQLLVKSGALAACMEIAVTHSNSYGSYGGKFIKRDSLLLGAVRQLFEVIRLGYCGDGTTSPTTSATSPSTSTSPLNVSFGSGLLLEESIRLCCKYLNPSSSSSSNNEAADQQQQQQETPESQQQQNNATSIQDAVTKENQSMWLVQHILEGLQKAKLAPTTVGKPAAGANNNSGGGNQQNVPSPTDTIDALSPHEPIVLVGSGSSGSVGSPLTLSDAKKRLDGTSSNSFGDDADGNDDTLAAKRPRQEQDHSSSETQHSPVVPVVVSPVQQTAKPLSEMPPLSVASNSSEVAAACEAVDTGRQ